MDEPRLILRIGDTTLALTKLEAQYLVYELTKVVGLVPVQPCVVIKEVK